MASLCITRGVRIVVYAAFIVSAPAGAQTAVPAPTTLVGMVRDSGGRPIQGVEVWLRGSDLLARTNDAGGFRIAGAPGGPVKVSLRRMGYEPATIDMQLKSDRIDSLVISLTESAASLPGILVEDEMTTRSKRLLAGFWERRSRGFGHYYTRGEIERKEPHHLNDIVRTTAGVNIVTVGGRPVIRLRGGMTAGLRDCPPQYWVDGMRAESASPDEFPPQDIEAIEVYAGVATIPPQFAPRTFGSRAATCGAIVIWTRLPGT